MSKRVPPKPPVTIDWLANDEAVTAIHGKDDTSTWRFSIHSSRERDQYRFSQRLWRVLPRTRRSSSTTGPDW